MEYVEGQDLGQGVKEHGPLPLVNACYYIQQAALGLQHASEKGLVHRDIKPSNLILSRQGKKQVVKILDFGLAKVTSENREDGGLTGEGKMLGTPDYVAPEQMKDAQKADIRADIYSLGCTLYYLLTGDPPFQGNNLYAILHAHQSIDARPLNLVRPEVPVELAAVVAKMMAKDPAQRYQKPDEVAGALIPFIKPGVRGPASKSAAELSQGAVDTTAESGGQSSVPDVQARRATPKTAPPAAAEATPVQPKQVWENLAKPDRVRQQRRPRAADPVPAKSSTKNQRWVWVSAVAGALLLSLLGVILYVSTDYGTIKIEVSDPTASVEIKVDDKN